LYCEAEASSGSDPAIRAHLALGCGPCDEKVAVYREVLRSLGAPALLSAPEAWVQEALRQIELRAPQKEKAAGTLQALAASVQRIRDAVREVQLGLVLDSQLGAALPGIRSAGTLAPRQLLFESGQGSLHLQVLDGDRGKVDLLGQFVPVEPPAGKEKIPVVLRREGAETQRFLTAAGSFRFAGIPAGTIEIRVTVGGTSLATGPILLRPDPDV
jgi:hypothetical protein